jgi:hypothetical protein
MEAADFLVGNSRTNHKYTLTVIFAEHYDLEFSRHNSLEILAILSAR